jgi:hypothetical protein
MTPSPSCRDIGFAVIHSRMHPLQQYPDTGIHSPHPLIRLICPHHVQSDLDRRAPSLLLVFAHTRNLITNLSSYRQELFTLYFHRLVYVLDLVVEPVHVSKNLCFFGRVGSLDLQDVVDHDLDRHAKHLLLPHGRGDVGVDDFHLANERFDLFRWR